MSTIYFQNSTFERKSRNILDGKVSRLHRWSSDENGIRFILSYLNVRFFMCFFKKYTCMRCHLTCIHGKDDLQFIWFIKTSFGSFTFINPFHTCTSFAGTSVARLLLKIQYYLNIFGLTAAHGVFRTIQKAITNN